MYLPDRLSLTNFRSRVKLVTLESPTLSKARYGGRFLVLLEYYPDETDLEPLFSAYELTWLSDYGTDSTS
jgi:hypothetical protein